MDTPAGLLGSNMALRREAYLETGGFPVIGFALAEDNALGEALCRAGWTIRYLTSPATLKPAGSSLVGFLERARRRALNLPPAVAWITRMMILSNLVLLLVAIFSSWKIWKGLLLIRYLAGLLPIGVAMTQYGASDLIPWVLLYEPALTLTGLYTAAANLLAKRWTWGNTQYTQPEPPPIKTGEEHE